MSARRSVLLPLCVCLLLGCGCASSSPGEPPEAPTAPLPVPAGATARAGATGIEEGAPADAETPSPTDADPAAAADSDGDPDGEEEPATEPVAEPVAPAPAAPREDAIFFPAAAHTLRLAGVHGLLGPTEQFLLIELTSNATGHDADETHRFEAVRSSRTGDALDSLDELTEPRVERHVVSVRDGGLRVGLAADPLRRVPEPTMILPLPPATGATWTVRTAGVEARCRVLGVAAAQTFAGALAGCVEVLVEDTDGARSTRHWHHQDLGIVRTEVRDASGDLLLGLALYEQGDQPTDAEVLAQFPLRR